MPAPPRLPHCPTPPKIRRAILVSLALLVAAVFANSLRFGFVNFDDPAYVQDNPHVTGPIGVQNLVWAWTTTHTSNWHPLTWWSLMVNAQWGDQASTFRLVNLLIHLGNVGVLFSAFDRMTGQPWRSAFVAAVFAVHPLRVESVTWIAERKDVLSVFFGLAALHAYANWSLSGKKSWWYATGGFYIASLLSKQTLVTFPLVLLLLDFWPLGRFAVGGGRPLFREKVPFFALAGVFSLIVFFAQRHGESIASDSAVPLDKRLLNAAAAPGWYCEKTVFPADLAVFYPHRAADLRPAEIAMPLAITASLLLAAALFGPGRPYLVMGIAWYMLTLLPMAGIIQVGRQSVADRYSYFPQIGLLIAITWTLCTPLEHGPRWRRVLLAAIGLLIVAGLAIAGWRQTLVWRDSQSLFRHALVVTTDNYLAHHQLGFALAAENQNALAEAHFREAIRILPDYPKAHNNLGIVLERLGRSDEALEHYQIAVEQDPGFALARFHYGSLLLSRGDPHRAITYLEPVVTAAPAHLTAKVRLAVAYAAVERRSDASRVAQAALALTDTTTDPVVVRVLRELAAQPGSADESRP